MVSEALTDSNQRMPTHRKRRRALLKMAGLILFAAIAVYGVRFSPLKGYLTPSTLEHFLDTSGILAPIVYMGVYALGVCLFVPGTVLTGIGAAIFGPYLGFVYAWAGAMAGASLAFLIGRTLGRDFAASTVGRRLRRYDEAIERNGFATVLYLRLVYFPFTPMNFGMGLTKVRFWDYFAGTGLGIITGTFILTFFIGTLKAVWRSGDWTGLLSIKVYFSVALFLFSLYIPRLIKRIRGEVQ